MIVPFNPTAIPTGQSLAELVTALGDIPLSRICANPPPGTATETHLLHFLDSDDKRLYELVDGTLVEKPMGFRESVLAAVIIRLVGQYVEDHDLGLVSAPDGPIRMDGGNVRMPDVSFIPWDHFPDGEYDGAKIVAAVPLLAVEVLSESNTVGEIARKRQEYFARGCKLMWIFDPETQSAEVYTSVKRVKKLDSTGTLTGDKILPGFTLPLAKLFASTTRRARKTKG